MSFVEKVRAQAMQAAEVAQKQAQDAQRVGKEKLNEVQTKRKADGLLRDLGAATYAEKTGQGNEFTTGEIERLLAELAVIDDGGSVIDLRKATGDAVPTDADIVDSQDEFGLGDS